MLLTREPSSFTPRNQCLHPLRGPGQPYSATAFALGILILILSGHPDYDLASVGGERARDGPEPTLRRSVGS